MVGWLFFCLWNNLPQKVTGMKKKLSAHRSQVFTQALESAATKLPKQLGFLDV